MIGCPFLGWGRCHVIRPIQEGQIGMIVSKSAVSLPLERYFCKVVEQVLGERILGKQSLAAFKNSGIALSVVLLNESVYRQCPFAAMSVKQSDKD